MLRSPKRLIIKMLVTDDANCTGQGKMLTYDGVFLPGLQISNGNKLTLHHGDIMAVLTRDDACISIESHLIVILKWRELFVSDLQGAFGDVVDLTTTREKKNQATWSTAVATLHCLALHYLITASNWERSRPYFSLLDERVEFIHLVIKPSCSDLPL